MDGDAAGTGSPETRGRRTDGPRARASDQPPPVPGSDRRGECRRPSGRKRLGGTGQASGPDQGRGRALVRSEHPRPAQAHGPAQAEQRRAHQGLPAADRGARSDPSLGHRDQPRRVGNRPPTRPRTARGRGPWPAPRHPDPAQGQHRDGRPDGDDRGLARPGRQSGPSRRGRRRPAPRRRRGHPRQDQPFRVGQLPRVHPGRLPGRPVPQRLERPWRVYPRSVRARLGSVWVELGIGRRPGRQPVRRGDRNRDRRLGRLPGRQQRRRRPEADARAGLAAGDHPDRPQPGHGRPDGPDRDRRGTPAQRDEVTIRAGEGRTTCPATTPASCDAAL